MHQTAKLFQLSVLVFALAALTTACNKSTSPDNPAAPAPTGLKPGKYYTDSAGKQSAKDVGGHLGIQVVLNNDQDFMHETDVNRVLSMLDRHQDVISPLAGDIEKIVIGNATAVNEDEGKYLVSVDFNISEAQLVKLFSQRFADYKTAVEEYHQFAVVTSLNVIDTVGFSETDVATVAVKLKNIVMQVNFAQDPSFTTLTLSTGGAFAVTQSGMSIDIFANDLDIVSQLKQGIEARMEWNAQVLPILQKLGLNLTYQPGVFTGAELSTAIASITQNQIATLIKSLNHQFSSIVIGKRWDQDLAHGVILMDYHATASEIAAKLQQFDRPTTDIDFVAAKSALNIVLSNRGIKIDQIIVDLPTTAASLDLVKQFTTDVASTVDVSLLQKLGARTLRLNADTTGFVPYSNILYVRVPTSGSDLSQFLRSAIYKTAFEQMNLMLANDASNLGLTLSFNVTDAVTSVQNDRLSSFLQWFAATVTPAVKANTKLTALVVTDAGYGTTFAHGQLNVDLETFDPNQMPYILVAPAPTPGH